MLEVVGARAAHRDGEAVGRAPPIGHFNRELAADVLARDRRLVAGDIFGRARGDDLAAMRARSRAEVNDVVRASNGLLVVLDDEDCVAEVSKGREGFQ